MAPPDNSAPAAPSRRGGRRVEPDLRNQKVLVVGLGKSGAAVANLCHAQGAQVTVTDGKPASALATQVQSLNEGIHQALGGHTAEQFTQADLIVVSPGVPDITELQAARAAQVAITGELELASRFIRSTLVGITGTNGKSTTTTLCGSIMAAAGRPTFVGGNVGVPLATAVNTPPGDAGGICVVEVSSFQALTMETFRPQVAVLLNISPDHLDRHGTMDDYVAAKARLFQAQQASDFAVMNLDDARVAEVARQVRSRWIPFSTQRTLSEGGWLEGETLAVRIPGGDIERYHLDNPYLVGRHNAENTLAAILAARLSGALPAEVRRGVLGFRALPHRMQLVAQAGGVRFYDDSKGTNVGAVVAALSGFPRPVVLIAGGRDKGASYEPLAKVLRESGRAVVLMGEAADRLEQVLQPVVPVLRAQDMEDAVRKAASVADKGDAVVLSPGGSSFDMFHNYEARGEAFQRAARLLETEDAEAGREPFSSQARADVPGSEP